MTSITKLLPMFAVTLLLSPHPLSAQTAPDQLRSPSVQLSDAEKQFDEIVRTFEQHLYASGAFAVNVTSNWTYEGEGQSAKGTNLFYLAVEKGGKYRIEAGTVAQGKAQYVCVSDGQQVTRLHRPAELYSQHPASVTHDDLEHDNLTLQTLSGSGVELLIRPQMRAQLIAQIKGVKLIGVENLGTTPVTHLKLDLVDGRTIDVWFSREEKPLMVQLATTERISISADKAVELVTTSKFAWRVGGTLPTGSFALSLPAGTSRVENLMAALREGDIRRLLGKPAPLFELNDLQGDLVRLSDYRGKRVVVLIFWASWCAPSTNSMDTLNAFVTEAEQGGAAVLAINLGEAAAQVQATIKDRQYRGRVLLDPEMKTLEMFQFVELPMTVLVGKDGTIQSFHSGSTTEARQRIRQDTAALIQGKQLSPTKTR